MIDQVSNFSTAADDIRNALDDINFEKEKTIPFGISFLDDALTGITPTDLIILAARSGAGKTETAIQIAMNAALNKKRVFFFALEAERGEIGRRQLYRFKAETYFKDNYQRHSGPVNYSEWMAKRLPDCFYTQFKEIADEMTYFDSLKIRYSDSSYTLEDFERDMISVGQLADLIILDHLHYFELDANANENAQYKTIVKAIRTHCLEKKIPVILVSHIRKGDTRYPTIVPDQEDFHGSSDIAKIGTKAITLASAQNRRVCALEERELVSKNGSSKVLVPIDIPPKNPHLYRTFIKAAKHRRNGSVMSAVGVLNFDPRMNVYEAGYLIGSQMLVENKNAFVISKEEAIPSWAINESRRK